MESNHNGITEKILAKQIKIKSKHLHTFYTDQTIYSNNKTIIKIPVANTYEKWNIESINKFFSPNIHMGTVELFFPKDCHIGWDRKIKSITDNIQTSENTFLDGQPRMVFGSKMKPVGLNVKYMGDEKYVIEKVRGEHYGISNLTTTLVGVLFTLSTFYLINQFDEQNKKK
jgi:hypothetical protein